MTATTEHTQDGGMATTAPRAVVSDFEMKAASPRRQVRAVLEPGGRGIRGQVPDQSALHGVLQALPDLGLPSRSVTQAPQQFAAEALPQDAHGLPRQGGTT